MYKKTIFKMWEIAKIIKTKQKVFTKNNKYDNLESEKEKAYEKFK